MLAAAVVGLGWWGQHIVRSMQGSAIMRIITGVDTNPAGQEFCALHSLSFHRDLAEVLERRDIEAVILATPHSLHAEQILQCAGAGKHVFCEKPLALRRSDAQRCVAACRAAGVALGVGHERRFEPAFEAVGDLLRSGSLGSFIHAEANFCHNKLASVPADNWRASCREAPAAGMTATGIHLTDAFISLFGAVESVYAVTTFLPAGRRNGDAVSAQLQFRDGGTGFLNSILATPLYLRFMVFGTRGWAEFRNSTHPDTPGPTSLQVCIDGSLPQTREFAWVNTVRANLEEFVAGVRGERPYRFTSEQLIGNIAVLEAVCEAAVSARPVAVCCN